jgi:hypothetical protein|tara:strand:+ start:773 stop:961 length:189 start_codon:yes stop_codon:yes gene_type:complete
MTEKIGSFSVELEIDTIMIKDSNGDLLKAESVRASEAVDRYKQVCIDFRAKIEDRKSKGLSY